MNGAGKTTLLRPSWPATISAGKVAWPGPGPAASPPATCHKKWCLTQTCRFAPATWSNWASTAGVSASRCGQVTNGPSSNSLLASVDALNLADARVGALSGGEQQKVLIAHALARHPLLLLLDEPLANLDLPSTQETVSLLSRIAKEQDVAVLLSAHDINPLLPVMDRVIYLAGGRAASGTTDEVVRSDVLSTLYGRHVDVFHAHGRVLVSVGDEHLEDGCEPAERGRRSQRGLRDP